jgi:serine/threonine protein kinase
MIYIIHILSTLSLLFQSRTAEVCTKEPAIIDLYNLQRFDSDKKGMIGGGAYGDAHRISWKGIDGKEAEKPAIVKMDKGKHPFIFVNEAETIELIHKETKAVHVPELYKCVVDENNRHYLIVERIKHQIAPAICKEGSKEVIANTDFVKFAELPAIHRLLIYAKMAEAIAEIHNRNVTHGDIKPENMLMSDISQDGRVYIIDFGGANKHGFCPFTGTGIYIDNDYLVNCLKWNEVTKKTFSENYNSEKQDIFALAVTIYFLENSYYPNGDKVKGMAAPFNSNSVTKESIALIANKVSSSDWIDDRELNYFAMHENKRLDFVDLIKEMVHSNRKIRPSAEEVATKLKRLAAGTQNTLFQKLKNLITQDWFKPSMII